MKTISGSVIAWAMASAALAGCGGSSKNPGATGDDGGSGTAGASGSGGVGGGGAGGTSGSGGGGDGGTGGGPQLTSAKLDLLLVVDNSRSMGEKHAILERSATELVSRLTNPRCLDAQGAQVAGQPANADAPCPAGSAREMAPVRDMHIGVISSSLGGHGADVCSSASGGFNPTQDDRGELLTRTGVPTYQSRGYLVWDPQQSASPPGESSAQNLATNLAALVTGAGEVGCGFEATLEAWYRFLVDPEPPRAVLLVDNVATVDGPNQTLLAQRAEFLRPDSAVLIVMLSDENDCSILDGGIGWLAGQSTAGGSVFTLPRATAACEANPNDVCCRSCSLIETGPPAGCPALDSDPGCTPNFHTQVSDQLGLRCWEQKRRFGVDFLYPIERYVDGLTSLTVQNRQEQPVPNPLYLDLSGSNTPPRDRSLISVAAIVGVPWQDLAKDPADASHLRYMTAAELSASNRWPVILGDPATATPPLDPFMRESVVPRSGTNPITGDAIKPPSAPTPLASPINGHEYQPPNQDDLQYACIFPLLSPRDCSDVSPCECNPTQQGNKPLCQAPDGTYGITQHYAKAYPGLRHLALLQELGTSSVVTSICPRNVTDSSRDDYAYNPAVQAIVDRMKHVMK